jgi:hypothetical protein
MAYFIVTLKNNGDSALDQLGKRTYQTDVSLHGLNHIFHLNKY